MPRPFLTARWQDVALVTYAFEPDRLRHLLPAECEFDLVDGLARCSLVAFDFLDVRVFGLRWPGHTNFPEVNLRFYVRRGGERGVFFHSEVVPKRAVAWIANAIYNEAYTVADVRSTPRLTADDLTIEHRFTVRGRPQRIVVTGRRPAVLPAEGGDEDWVKEHHWGFGQTRGGRPLSYEVSHPRWKIYPHATAELSVDFAHLYGPDLAFLNDAAPVSTILAVGSAVSVSPKELGQKGSQ